MEKTKLQHRYFALRHGASLAMDRGIVVSSPEAGVLPENGLSDLGKKQAAEVDLSPLLSIGRKILFCSSDFSRAKQTAELVSCRLHDTEHLLDKQVHIHTHLRERFFGIHEGQANTAYQKIWDVDLMAPVDDNTRADKCEPTAYVSNRVKELIHALEAKYQDMELTIVLTAHGDTLQITQTMFAGIPANHHRSILHLNPCEFRELKPTADSCFE